jgi:hypothetical protein
MSLIYVPGFDTAEIGTFSVVIGGAVGSGTATVTPGTYSHSTATLASTYTPFATAVAAALNAVAGGFTVTLSPTTFLYTIANATAFTLTWTGVGGVNLQRALGYTATTGSGTSAVGNARPWYLMVSEIGGRTAYSDVYEPDDIVEEAVADGGTSYAVAKDTDETWCDWTQAMEPVAATLIRRGTTAKPWTWEHFFKHVRGTHPFLVSGDAPSGYSRLVYRLRAEGASFNGNVRKRVTSDWDDLWNIMFMAREIEAG